MEKRVECEMPLERGLCYAYEVIDEFEEKQFSKEKQIAIAYETGIEIGKCLMKMRVANIFKPDSKVEWA